MFVHTDSVHRHFNPYDEKALALVVKAKCTWMFMGLIQQGRSGPMEREDEFGPREDWSAIWTPGVLDRKKCQPVDTVWERHRPRPRPRDLFARAHRPRPPLQHRCVRVRDRARRTLG